MNKIRVQMAKEIGEVKPEILLAYSLIVRFQASRTGENEVRLRLQLRRVSRALQVFKGLVQPKWRPYLEALEEGYRFPIGDLICAFDCAIHQMHIVAAREGADQAALGGWGEEMRLFLDQRRAPAIHADARL